MELLVKSLQSILDEKLSLVERGILISIALCRDENKKITLAKFRATCKFRTIKEELVSLHERDFIKWSGYEVAKRSLRKTEIDFRVAEVMEFFNKCCNRKYSISSKSSTTHLKNRLQEHSIEDIKLVIANRYQEWNDDPQMSKHLNPTTVFRPSKFEKYLEEAKRTRIGESFVAAENIGLKDGDEITSKVVNTFSDKDTYNIKIYQCDGEGNSRSNGVPATRYGSDIKKMFKLQRFNSIRTHRYYYVQK